MRILNIMLAQVRGGVETMALRYHEAMRAAGLNVLSVGHKDGVLGTSLPAAEIAPEFAHVNALVNHDPFAALRIRAIARDFKPDLVLTHGNRATGIALLPFLGTAAKTVQVVHNFRHKGQITRARAAICVSHSVHASLKAAYPDLPMYDISNFGPLSERPVKPAPTAIPVLGTLARLHVNKGLDVAIRAIGLLKARGVPVILRIAGEGPERAHLDALVRDNGVTDQVQFCGWVNEIAGYLNSLDLFVLPSRVEPFGLVVTEAMAAGAPVIASRIDGPREILRDGDLGTLSPKDDPAALADAIAAALADWPGVLDRARRAQAYALTHFSLEAGQARLKSVLNDIVQHRLAN